jgi:hypothetical protein
MADSPLLHLLACEARAYVTSSVVAELPCESFRSAHWHRLARVWPFDLFARTEPDDNDPETGAEQIGLIVELRAAGDRIGGAALWGIQTPELQSDWASFYVDLAESCHQLIEEATNTNTVRRYLEERLLTAQDLLKATYETPVAA